MLSSSARQEIDPMQSYFKALVHDLGRAIAQGSYFPALLLRVILAASILDQLFCT